MSSEFEAIKEQNRLIIEQNALLRKLAEQREIIAQETASCGRMMTDNDVQLILRSDDIYGAIDRWNAGCKQEKVEK